MTSMLPIDARSYKISQAQTCNLACSGELYIAEGRLGLEKVENSQYIQQNSSKQSHETGGDRLYCITSEITSSLRDEKALDPVFWESSSLSWQTETRRMSSLQSRQRWLMTCCTTQMYTSLWDQMESIKELQVSCRGAFQATCHHFSSQLTRKIPADWRLASMAPLCKPGWKKDLGSHRPVHLTLEEANRADHLRYSHVGQADDQVQVTMGLLKTSPV